MENDPLDIRPPRTIEDYRGIEQLQRSIWNMDDIRVVPDNILITAHRNGGVLLIAYDHSLHTVPTDPFDTADSADRMIGFVFGFVGLHEGKPKHCSHQAGVLRAYQNRGIGYRLKLAQRDYVLAQGIDHITWTFDPLESRNAAFNLRKLGAISTTYIPNIYGIMRDQFHAGLPSDRFQVDWYLTSPRVTDRIAHPRAPDPDADTTLLANTPIISAMMRNTLPYPSEDSSAQLLQMSENGIPHILVQIPSDFQAIKAADLSLAQTWRQHTRHLFSTAFAHGYATVDMISMEHHCYYLLEHQTVLPL